MLKQRQTDNGHDQKSEHGHRIAIQFHTPGNIRKQSVTIENQKNADYKLSIFKDLPIKHKWFNLFITIIFQHHSLQSNNDFISIKLPLNAIDIS